MSPDVIKAHAATLQEWAELWSREDGREGAGEVAFLLVRASRLMLGDQSASQGYIGPLGGVDVSLLQDDLPPAVVQSEIEGDE